MTLSGDSTRPLDGEFPELLNGRYKLVREIGRGGIGVVYLAVDLLLKRHVAVKFLSMRFADNGMWRERFYREARATATLSNSNIVTIYDIGDYRGRVFLVMEYLDGGNLKDALPLDPNETPRVGAIIRGICSGLAAAHRAEIVHRDIKPGNVLLGCAGEVKIADFGLARVAMDIDLTASGINMIGTPSYMSPEQVLGRDANSRSDVFSLGVVFYEVITGRLPFRASGEHTMNEAILNHPPAPIDETIVSSWAPLVKIINRCLSKRPDDRFESAVDVLQAVDQTAAGRQATGARLASRQSPPSIGFGTACSLKVRTATMSQHLACLFDLIRSHAKCGAILRGAKGVGKTTLVEQLVADLKSPQAPAEWKQATYHTCVDDTLPGLLEFLADIKRRVDQTESASLIIRVGPFSSFNENAELIGNIRASLEAIVRTSKRILLLPESREVNDAVDSLVRSSPRALTKLEAGRDYSEIETILPSGYSGSYLARLTLKLAPPGREACLKLARALADEWVDIGMPRLSEQVLQEILNLTDAFVPSLAQPAKALVLLREWVSSSDSLAQAPSPEGELAALDAFFARSIGLPSQIISATGSAESEADISKLLRAQGLPAQSEPALVDGIFLRLKSRMHDHTKPFGSLALLGPPGVGKFETAETLASLFAGEGVVPVVLNFRNYQNVSDAAKVVESIFAPIPECGPVGVSLPRTRVFIFQNVHLCTAELADALLAGMVRRSEHYQIEIRDELKMSFFLFVYDVTAAVARSFTALSSDSQLSELARQLRLREALIGVCPQLSNLWMLVDGVIAYGPLDDERKELLLNRQITSVLDRIGVAQRNLLVDVADSARQLLMDASFSEAEGARTLRLTVESALSLPLARLLSNVPDLRDSVIIIKARNGQIYADTIEAVPTDTARDSQSIDDRRQVFVAKQQGEDGSHDHLAEAEMKIRELKQKFAYDAAVEKTEELRQKMSEPSFWGASAMHTTALIELARLNRITDRVHSWESRFERIRACLVAVDRSAPVSHGAMKSQLYSLLKDLDSAALEIMLDGPNDRDDAFLILYSRSAGPGDQRWLAELSRVYTGWARHRNYRYTLLGELDPEIEKALGIILHIAGISSFGLLKGESGEHRKISSPRRSVGYSSRMHRCQVLVLPDSDLPSVTHVRFDLTTKKLGHAAEGIRFRRPTRSVRITEKKTGARMHLLCGSMIEDNQALYLDFFGQYLLHSECETEPPDRFRISSAAGEPLRTYEDGAKARVIDHRTNIVFENPHDYFSGKIDSLLLERLTS